MFSTTHTKPTIMTKIAYPSNKPYELSLELYMLARGDSLNLGDTRYLPVVLSSIICETFHWPFT